MVSVVSVSYSVIPFSRGSSQPRDWTQFSCIAGWPFTVSATYIIRYKVTNKICVSHSVVSDSLQPHGL